MDKTLSVIIPVYNPNIEHFIRCIDSIYSQMSDEIDVIIVDDASTDKSFLNVLADKDCTILTNKKNLKAGLARQRGLDYSKATFVTFVDQDDELVEGKLLYMVDRLKSSGCELIYKTHQLIAHDYDYKKNGLCFEEPCNDFLHGAFLNRQGLIDNEIRFSDKLKGTEDTYLLAKINAVLFHSDNLWLSMEEPDITYIWYLWDDSTSHRPMNDGIYFIETFDTFVDCHIDTITWAKEKWNNPNFYIPRTLAVLLNIYFYVQYYKFSKEITEKMQVEATRFVRWVLDFLQVSKTELIDMVNSRPELYYQEFNETQKRYMPFVPAESLRDWL